MRKPKQGFVQLRLGGVCVTECTRSRPSSRRTMSNFRQGNGPSIRYRTVELLKGETLGTGSFGAVCKARCDGIVCAAKMVHSTLIEEMFSQYSAGTVQILRRFQQECEFMSEIRHPNIVQYLGTHQDPDSGLPVLLMELMDESLTHFLENSPLAIAYHTQVNLCRDVALALSFLHSNGIIHRDLSSNNVLLDNQGTRAKVTDFGMSRLGLNPHATYTDLTICPGTMSYMPPEALQDVSVYDEKMDCFSFGVLIVQVLTRKFPDPESQYRVYNAESSQQSDRFTVLVPEVERRQNHISKIEPWNPLLPVALDCLKDSDSERPSSQALYQRLESLMESPQFSNSLQDDSPRLRAGSSTQSTAATTEIQMSRSHGLQYGRQESMQDPNSLCGHQRRQLWELRQMLEYTLLKITQMRQINERKRNIAHRTKQAVERSDKVIASVRIQVEPNYRPSAQQHEAAYMRHYENIPPPVIFPHRQNQQPLYTTPPRFDRHRHEVVIQQRNVIFRREDLISSGSGDESESVQDSGSEYHLPCRRNRRKTLRYTEPMSDSSSVSSRTSTVYTSGDVTYESTDDTDSSECVPPRLSRSKYRTHTVKQFEKSNRTKRSTRTVPEEYPQPTCQMADTSEAWKREFMMLNELGKQYVPNKRSAGKDGYVAVLYMPISIPSATEQWDAVLAVYPRDISIGHPFFCFLTSRYGLALNSVSVNFHFARGTPVQLEVEPQHSGHNIECSPEDFAVDKQVVDNAVCDYTTYPPRCTLTVNPTGNNRLSVKLSLRGAITQTNSILRLKQPRISAPQGADRMTKATIKKLPTYKRKQRPFAVSPLSETDSLSATSVCSEDYDSCWVLKEEPHVHDFMERVGCYILHKWECMAFALGLQPNQVEEIRLEQNTRGTDARGYIREVFLYWHNHSSSCSWTVILTALKSRQVNEKRLAEKVKKKLMLKAMHY